MAEGRCGHVAQHGVVVDVVVAGGGDSDDDTATMTGETKRKRRKWEEEVEEEEEEKDMAGLTRCTDRPDARSALTALTAASVGRRSAAAPHRRDSARVGRSR